MEMLSVFSALSIGMGSVHFPWSNPDRGTNRQSELAYRNLEAAGDIRFLQKTRCGMIAIARIGRLLQNRGRFSAQEGNKRGLRG